MTTEAQLLRHICENPENNLSRLVYADWLEENATTGTECRPCEGTGDVGGNWPYACETCHGTGSVSDGRMERAEFIRVQIEVNEIRTPVIRKCTGENPSTIPDPLVVRHDTLRRRERELLNQHAIDWRSGIPILCHEMRETALCVGIENQHTLDTQIRFRRGFVASIACPAAVWQKHGKDIVTSQPIQDLEILHDNTGPWYPWGHPVLGKKTKALAWARSLAFGTDAPPLASATT